MMIYEAMNRREDRCFERENAPFPAHPDAAV